MARAIQLVLCSLLVLCIFASGQQARGETIRERVNGASYQELADALFGAGGLLDREVPFQLEAVNLELSTNEMREFLLPYALQGEDLAALLSVIDALPGTTLLMEGRMDERQFRLSVQPGEISITGVPFVVERSDELLNRLQTLIVVRHVTRTASKNIPVLLIRYGDAPASEDVQAGPQASLPMQPVALDLISPDALRRSLIPRPPPSVPAASVPKADAPPPRPAEARPLPPAHDPRDTAPRPEASGRVEKAERADRAGRTEKAERAEKLERTERQERAEKSERVERTEKPDRSGPSERMERAERTERPEKPERGAKGR